MGAPHHIAHQKCRGSTDKNSHLVRFTMNGITQRIPLTACLNSEYLMLRLARYVFIRLEEGKEKATVEQLKTDYLQHFKNFMARDGPKSNGGAEKAEKPEGKNRSK